MASEIEVFIIYEEKKVLFNTKKTVIHFFQTKDHIY